MRYKLIFTLLLISSSIYGQVQKKFFVKDVERLEYVTVKFCVDNEAKISEVTIVEEKTTYKNDYSIEQLRLYLLGVQYYEDSKLKNNCYNSTFEFINEKYEKKKLSEAECKACDKFKSGLYKYKHVLYQDFRIKRKRKIQREVTRKEKQIYYIKWLNNCTYILTYKRMTEKRLKHLIGKEIHVEIIGILDNGDYLYRSKPNFEEKVDYGVIQKVK